MHRPTMVLWVKLPTSTSRRCTTSPGRWQRRWTLVFPAEKTGGQFGKALTQPAWAFLGPLLGDLGPADRAGFERVLGRLREHFKAAEDNGRTDAGIS